MIDPNSDMEELFSLIIEEKFLIKGRGLVLIPVLRLPKVSGFKPFSDKITILKPGGVKENFSVQFILEHFHLQKEMSKWRIIILLPNKTPDDIPDSSEVLVTGETISRLEVSTR